MKRIKKLFAVMLLSLTLFNSIFTSYSMTVQAAEAIPITMTALDAMLSLFGVSIGIGNQVDHIGNRDIMADVMEAASSGGAVTMSNYGTVDFSSSESVNHWLTWCADHNDYTLGRYEGNNVWDNTVDKVARTLDGVSYAVSGVCATNAMNDSITGLVGKLAGDYSVEDIHDACTVFSGEDNGTLTWDKWNVFSAIASAVILSNADTFVDIVDSFTIPEETIFNEYSPTFAASSDLIFNGSYVKSVDGNYAININALQVLAQYNRSLMVDTTYFYPLVLVYESSIDTCNIYRLNGDDLVAVQLTVTSTRVDTGATIIMSTYALNNVSNVSANIPIFCDRDSAINALKMDDFSSAENYEDVASYPDFKNNVGTAAKPLSTPLKGLITANPSMSTLKDAVPKILEVSDTVAGTADAVTSVSKAIADAAGMDITTGEEDTVAGGYTGILEGILAVLEGIWEGVLAIPAYLQGILEAVAPLPFGNGNNEDDNNSSGSGSLSGGSPTLINGLIALILILFKLLQIFLHLLEFIVNIFKIPADPGFIGDGDFATGFNYIKTVQLSPLYISVYDFLMGLVHILIIFGVVGALRKRIDRLHT